MADKTWRDLKKLEFNISGTDYKWWSVDHYMDLHLYIGSLSTELIKFKLEAYNTIDSAHKIAALRQLQHEGFEFLFALLCSLNYDIKLIPAWMSLYQNSDVYSITSDLMKPLNKDNIIGSLSKLFSQEFYTLKVNGEGASLELFLETFYIHLLLLKNDFLSELSKSEYISIKHSYRVSSGESSFAISLDDAGFQDLIFGSETVLHIAAKRLGGVLPQFNRRDVQVTHVTVSHSTEVTVGKIEILLSLTDSLVAALKNLAKNGRESIELDIPDHKENISKSAAFKGNGSIIQHLKDFRSVESAIQATLDIDFSIQFSREELFFNSFGSKSLLKNPIKTLNRLPRIQPDK